MALLVLLIFEIVLKIHIKFTVVAIIKGTVQWHLVL